MSDLTLADIRIYPIKSTASVPLAASNVTPLGLQHDRRWAVINRDQIVITAREYPRLLDVSVVPCATGLELQIDGDDAITVENPSLSSPSIKVSLFSDRVEGSVADDCANQWLSAHLGIDCQLIYMTNDRPRPLADYLGGKPQDSVSYADECPVLLVSQASLIDLNRRIGRTLSMARFRPNLVVNGGLPYQEDRWKRVSINGCEFDVVQRCERCVLTTIDPDSGEKDIHQEPLRTLASYRKVDGGGVIFGVHLVPRSVGSVSIGAPLIVS